MVDIKDGLAIQRVISNWNPAIKTELTELDHLLGADVNCYYTHSSTESLLVYDCQRSIHKRYFRIVIP